MKNRDLKMLYSRLLHRFAPTLGIPRNSLNRYENGILVQTKATDNLLRIVDRFPETYDFLQHIKENS